MADERPLAELPTDQPSDLMMSSGPVPAGGSPTSGAGTGQDSACPVGPCVAECTNLGSNSSPARHDTPDSFSRCRAETRSPPCNRQLEDPGQSGSELARSQEPHCDINKPAREEQQAGPASRLERHDACANVPTFNTPVGFDLSPPRNDSNASAIETHPAQQSLQPARHDAEKSICSTEARTEHRLRRQSQPKLRAAEAKLLQSQQLHLFQQQHQCHSIEVDIEQLQIDQSNPSSPNQQLENKTDSPSETETSCDSPTQPVDMCAQNLASYSPQVLPGILNMQAMSAAAAAIARSSASILPANRPETLVAARDSSVYDFNETSPRDPAGSSAMLTRKLAKRKASVFSLDGFPSMELLDQQNFKIRSALQLDGENERNKPNQQEQRVEKPQEQIRLTTMTQESAEMIASDDFADQPVAGQTGSTRRPVRADTLGSTGSSRASSCDEPTIVAIREPVNSVFLSAQVSTESTPLSVKDPIQLKDPSVEAIERKISSSSSLDSMPEDWSPDEFRGQTGDSDPLGLDLPGSKDGDKRSSHARTKEPYRSYNIIHRMRRQPVSANPPFEPIKVQMLKRKSIPNPSELRKHIDNLISWNDSVVDNWNLVTIRPYNSSMRDPQSGNLQTGPSGLSDRVSDELFGKQAPAPTMPRSTKRWSTTAIGTPNQPIQQPLFPASSLGSASSSSGNNSASSGYSSSSSGMLNSGTPQRYFDDNLNAMSRQNALRSMQHQIQRRRSYNLPQRLSGVNWGDNPMLSTSSRLSTSSLRDGPMMFGVNRLPPTLQRLYRANSAYAPPTVHPLPKSPPPSSILDVQKTFANSHLGQQHSYIHRHHNQETQHRQLENSIQNLSLKRRDSELLPQAQPTNLVNPFALSLNNQEQRAQIRNQNLVLNRQPQLQQHQQQHRDVANSEQQLKVMNAFMMEKYQRSLAGGNLNADNRELLLNRHHQDQQLIETQLRLNQMAASIERNRQQRADNPASQRPITWGAGAMPSMLAPLRLRGQPESRVAQAQAQAHMAAVAAAAAAGRHRESLASAMMADEIARSAELAASEMLRRPLDNSLPMFRCGACDVSFWTEELLEYHKVTQCAARRTNQPPGSLAFKFTGPNNFDQHYQSLIRQQQHQQQHHNHHHQQQQIPRGLQQSNPISAPRRVPVFDVTAMAPVEILGLLPGAEAGKAPKELLRQSSGEETAKVPSELSRCLPSEIGVTKAPREFCKRLSAEETIKVVGEKQKRQPGDTTVKMTVKAPRELRKRLTAEGAVRKSNEMKKRLPGEQSAETSSELQKRLSTDEVVEVAVVPGTSQLRKRLSGDNLLPGPSGVTANLDKSAVPACDSSILKHQLIITLPAISHPIAVAAARTAAATAAANDAAARLDSLPFKKRKISDQTMRY